MVAIVEKLIKSKIEYIDYEQEYLYQTFDEFKTFSPSEILVQTSEKKLKRVKSKFDELIERIEQLTYSRTQLLVIRTFLKNETAEAIYELLTNEKYLFYSPKSLQRLLGLETYLNDFAFQLEEN